MPEPFRITQKNAMKNNRKDRLQLCNRMISGALALLGVASCSTEAPCEYGTPYCTFGLKGKVTEQEGGTVLEGKRVIIKRVNADRGESPDTLLTGKNGTYQWEKRDFMPETEFRIICEDPAGAYEADSVDVKMKAAGGSGWYVGRDDKEVNFTLKKKS